MSTLNVEVDRKMIYQYLYQLQQIKNNTSTKLQQWQYIKNNVITKNLYSQQQLKNFFLKYNIIPAISFQYIKKHIDKTNCDFYFRQYKNGYFAIKLLNIETLQQQWDGCNIVCPRCKQKYRFIHEPKLYRERNHLFCAKCICHYAQTIGGGQQKFQNTMIQKYGVKRPIQNKQIKEKTQKTMMQRYDAPSPLQSKIVKQKIANTMIQRYGDDNPFKIQIFKDKIIETYKQKYGQNYYEEKMKSFYYSPNNKYKVSNISNNFFKQLSKYFQNYTLFWGEEQKSFFINNNTIYYTDFYIQQLNLAVQFQGDFFHANPQIYKQNDLVLFGKKRTKAKNIWEKDKKRKQNIENKYNCVILYVWQKNVRENMQNEIRKVKQEILKHAEQYKGDQKV